MNLVREQRIKLIFQYCKYLELMYECVKENVHFIVTSRCHLRFNEAFPTFMNATLNIFVTIVDTERDDENFSIVPCENTRSSTGCPKNTPKI